jgi:hypothetical protein
MPLTEQLKAAEIIDANFELTGRTAIGKNMFGLVFESRPMGHPELSPKKPKAARRKTLLGEVRDVDGRPYDVHSIRPTQHGFDLYFGLSGDDDVRYLGGPARLVVTKALRDFWEANRTKGHGFLFDLPAGRTTLKRARRRLGLNFLHDTREFWMDRLEDLQSLSVREFSVRHGVAMFAAFEWRRRIIGTCARPSGWWRKAKYRRILLSSLVLREVARKLGIGTSTASRLRRRTQAEALVVLTPAA